MIYPQDLNKASISKINRKNILKISSCSAFYNKNIIDYVYINQIIRLMTAENRTEECINMLKDYNITLKNIESTFTCRLSVLMAGSFVWRFRKIFETGKGAFS